MKRVDFLRKAGVSSVAMLTGISLANVVAGAPRTSKHDMQDAKPRLEADLVREFVIAGHGDLDKVKSMLQDQPGLLNASWDWGGGDFEEAIEGAAHVGNRDIALYLIEKGARMNVFTAAMLGHFHIVQQMVDAFPALLKAEGPHGLDLMHHAEAGGKEALKVLNYLKSKR